MIGSVVSCQTLTISPQASRSLAAQTRKKVRISSRMELATPRAQKSRPSMTCVGKGEEVGA